jgi:uncharacterized protein (TIGR00255 family)
MEDDNLIRFFYKGVPMILSMTGYGTGSAQRDDISVIVEIRTVNHRLLDLHVRISREYLFLEGEIQKLVRKTLERGRVDLNVTIQNAGAPAFLINNDLVKSYIEAAGNLQKEFQLQDSLDLKTLLGLPGVLKNGDAVQAEDQSIIAELVQSGVREALDGVLQMRRREGASLLEDMSRNLAAIEESTGCIREMSANSAAECFDKLQERLAQLTIQGGIDPQRLAQEAALIADKCDISEEVARLESHIEQYHSLMNSKEKVGKKLDFLLQELQRESNTILSKSANLEVAQRAISIKTDIEKLREQVQNVE